MLGSVASHNAARASRRKRMATRGNNLTVKAQEAVQAANELASEHGNPELLTVHLLAALMADREGVVWPVLTKLGGNAQAITAAAEQEIAKLPKVSGGAQQASLSPAANKIIESAFKQAENFKDEYVSTEHLLLALANAKGDPAQKILGANGATHDAILKALTSVRGSQRDRPGSRSE